MEKLNFEGQDTVMKCHFYKFLKLGFSHILEQYLDGNMKNYTKENVSCVKTMSHALRSTHQLTNTMVKWMTVNQCEGHGQGHQV